MCACEHTESRAQVIGSNARLHEVLYLVTLYSSHSVTVSYKNHMMVSSPLLRYTRYTVYYVIQTFLVGFMSISLIYYHIVPYGEGKDYNYNLECDIMLITSRACARGKVIVYRPHENRQIARSRHLRRL